jgi:hypothetical protein
VNRGSLLYLAGQALVTQANKKASRANKLNTVNKGRLIPKVTKLLCELVGWGWFVFAAFSIDPIAGKIVAGVAFLVFAFRIEIGESPDEATGPADPLVRR